MKGNLGITKLGEEKILVDFEVEEEVFRVLVSGLRSFPKVHLDLEWWTHAKGAL